MQDEINKTENSDTFSDLFRQKLENHNLPVDKAVWQEIEKKLPTHKSKFIPFWFWISGGAAVALIALLFTIRSFNESESYISKTNDTQLNHIQQSVKNKVVAVAETKKVFQIEKKNPMHQNENAEKITSLHEINMPHYVNVEFDSLKSTYAKNDSTVQQSVNEKSFANIKTADTISTSQKKEIFPIQENNIALNKTKRLKSFGSGILLAATFSAGGSLPASSNGYEMAVGDRNIVSASPNYTSIMTPNEFSQITYLTPVSFGFVVQKPINEKLKLESGLVYTYLSTNFRNNGVQQNTADLHLHYIGIPLNLIAIILDNSKWEFYLSGGGMLEKGIRSIYIQNQKFGNQTITTTASTNISGVQWSVNGAVGTTYKIQKNMGIYFEPKISYFFNNNQPISGRTDQPVSVGLTAGLRYQLK